MNFIFEKDLRYAGKSWNAANIRSFKNGEPKTEADFIKQTKNILSEPQAKELYKMAHEKKPNAATENKAKK